MSTPKLTLRKFLCALFLTLVFNFSQAQTDINSSFSNRMNYIFQQLEKNRVPNGLLLDYAMEFTELKNYNAVLTESNKLNADTLVYTGTKFVLQQTKNERSRCKRVIVLS